MKVAGVSLEQPDHLLGFRPAHVAAEAGNLSMVRALEALGADLSALSKDGWSPLGLALDRGHHHVALHLDGELLAMPEERIADTRRIKGASSPEGEDSLFPVPTLVGLVGSMAMLPALTMALSVTLGV